jgi:hypothetical protein
VAVGFGLPEGWHAVSKFGELRYGLYRVNLHGVGLVMGPEGQRYAVAVLGHGWEDRSSALTDMNAVGGYLSCLVSSGAETSDRCATTR